MWQSISYNVPTTRKLYLCRSGGTGRCREASAALAASSLSFFTVSLPMWFSFEMGSSREGISCFFRFFVRLVTTCVQGAPKCCKRLCSSSSHDASATQGIHTTLERRSCPWDLSVRLIQPDYSKAGTKTATTVVMMCDCSICG